MKIHIGNRNGNSIKIRNYSGTILKYGEIDGSRN